MVGVIWIIDHVLGELAVYKHRAKITIGPEVAAILGRSRWIRNTQDRDLFLRECAEPKKYPLAAYGLSSRLLGIPLYLNESQELGTMDIWGHDDEFVTLRVES